MKRILLRFRRWLWAIAIASVLCISAIAGYYTVQHLPGPVVKWMLDTDIRPQAELWQKRILLRLSDGARLFATQDIGKADQTYLELIPEASDIYRFKLINRSGVVFWSTRKSDVGKQIEGEYFLNQVALGEMYIASARKPATEIDGLSLHSLNANSTGKHLVYEVYVPVIENGSFLGAIEFYTDLTEVHDVLYDRVWRGVLIAVILINALIAAAVLFMLRTSLRQLQRVTERNDEERAALEQQMQLAREVKLLGELNEWLQSSRSLSELFEMVAKFMSHMFLECEGSVYVFSNSRDVLVGAAGWNGGECKPHIHPESCWGLRRGRTYSYGTSEVEFICEHAEPHDGRQYFCFPILAHGETVGLMHLKKKQGLAHEAFADIRKLAQMSAEQISMAIANVKMRDQLQDQPIRDPLTGLYNRRHMLDRLRHLLDQAKRRQGQLSLVYLDVDHFKNFNDTHGHDAGDMVLRAFGEVLEAHCDGDDLACRMGGEEFMLIWQDATPDLTKERVSKLQEAVANVSVRYGDKQLPKITFSAGIARAPDDGMEAQDLLRAADNAMYRAKKAGRDQFLFATAKKFSAPNGTANGGIAAE